MYAPATRTAPTVASGVQIFAWLGTLMSGRPRFNVPMLWLAGAIAATSFGYMALARMALPDLPLSVRWHAAMVLGDLGADVVRVERPAGGLETAGYCRSNHWIGGFANSAGHTATPHYYLGLLSLTGSDPMDPTAWRKEPGPVFAPYEGPEGRVDTPGHNSFTRSPDGTEDWLVYHARDHAPPPGLRAAERTVRIQPFGWTGEGLPVFGHPIPPGVPIPRPSGE